MRDWAPILTMQIAWIETGLTTRKMRFQSTVSMIFSRRRSCWKPLKRWRLIRSHRLSSLWSDHLPRRLGSHPSHVPTGGLASWNIMKPHSRSSTWAGLIWTWRFTRFWTSRDVVYWLRPCGITSTIGLKGFPQIPSILGGGRMSCLWVTSGPQLCMLRLLIC